MTHTRLTHIFLCISLLALGVAAAAGSLIRFGLYLGMPPWAQNITAVRHAHSHLMYFGWGTLGIMALIWYLLPRFTGRRLPRAVLWQMAATALVAGLSFPAFWANGYGVTQIGPAALPLGSIVSGWNGLSWFVFIALYVRATRNMDERPLPVQLWDWAIMLLLLSCAGALGFVVLVMVDHPSHFLHQATLHLFLDLFAVGWFTLALLGLLWAWIGQQTVLPRRLPTGSLALCLAPTFILGISPTLVPQPIYWIAAFANLGAALLLACHLRELWRRRSHLPLLIHFGLVALGIHLLTALSLLWPGFWQWSSGTQLRIFFLHNLLLGWMSSTLLGLFLAQWLSQVKQVGQLLGSIWIGGVSLMLLALLGLGFTSVIPWVPAINWLQLAAWSSVPLVGVALGVILAAVFIAWKWRDTMSYRSTTPLKTA